MSNEIVAILDEDSNEMQRCRPDDHGSDDMEDIPLFHRLGLSRPAHAEVKLNLIGGNHPMTYFFHPDKGHRYVNQSNPTPVSVEPLLEKMKDPSMLLLRGCESLLQEGHNFPFGKFKTLSILEISGVRHLTIVPREVSEMAQLESLTLSHLPIKHLADDFFSNLVNLRSFVIKSCSNLHSFPRFATLTPLETLHLSDLHIKILPEGFFSDIKELRWLILRGCSELCSLPSINTLESLEVLDLAHCITLQDVWLNDSLPMLRVVDLSYTALKCTRQLWIYLESLTHVFCRDAKGSVYKAIECAINLQVLDLSGVGYLGWLHEFHIPEHVKSLDLSRSGVEFTDFLSKMTSLRILLLRECTAVVELPSMKRLTMLEVLDVSGCGSLVDLPEDLCELVNLKELNLSGCSLLGKLREGVFDKMTCLEKLDLSKTNFSHLNRSRKLVEVASHGFHLNHRAKIPQLDEFHLVSTFTTTSSAFYRFKHNFTHVKNLILSIQRKFESTTNSSNIILVDLNAINVVSSAENTFKDFKRYFGRKLADFEYILEKIDLLESSDNEGAASKLLHDLMYVVEHLKANELQLDSANINHLFCLVTKLKLLLPRSKEHRDPGLDKEDVQNPRLAWINKDEKEADINIDPKKRQELHTSYDSLTKSQKYCLLYFAVSTPRREGDIWIKDRRLIHLWDGEGFIDAHSEENDAAVSCDDSPQPINPPSRSNRNTVEEIGRHILDVLQEKQFIWRSQLSKSCVIDSTVQSFVRKQAKAEGFFDFDNHNGKLTPRFALSQRACLLKSRYNFPSSCELWVRYINSSKKLEHFKHILTLFNVNECIVDIRAEWLSKMKNLHVLHLGRWDNASLEHIEVVDLSFLEELKGMMELRILSLEGVAAIRKLPDSICKPTNLKILNLRECSDLEELPAGIGSLKNLTHLDVTNCPLLSMFPKGIMLLSKLEVLKGFVINYDADGRQNKKACTLEKLKLGNLRKLNLVVNIEKFPNSEDLQVFKNMRNLCNLKITWLPNTYVAEITQDTVRQKATKHSRWQQLKCWEQQTHQNDIEETLRSSGSLGNLKKLVLCCFPIGTAPSWICPRELNNLERLYIQGGLLKTLPIHTSENTWNVHTLHLKHVLKLDIDWELLTQIFPNMTYMMKAPDDHLSAFPVNFLGVWKIDNEYV